MSHNWLHTLDYKLISEKEMKTKESSNWVVGEVMICIISRSEGEHLICCRSVSVSNMLCCRNEHAQYDAMLQE